MFRSQDDWLAEIYRVMGRLPPKKTDRKHWYTGLGQDGIDKLVQGMDADQIEDMIQSLKKERIKNIMLNKKKKAKKPGALDMNISKDDKNQ